MTTRKVNLGIAISRNFDKVNFEILDEPIEFESEEEFKAKTRRIFSILREEINLEFKKIQK